MEFKFLDNKNTMVITTKNIVKGENDIKLVSHDEDDGMWEFLDGDEVDEKSAVIVSLLEMVRIDSSINELFDLPLGWIAYREKKNLNWTRRRWCCIIAKIESVVESVSKSRKTTKPSQVHHYATNKSRTYTPQLEEIVNKYGFSLDDVWNKDLLPHQGRHPNAYHDYILDNMQRFDRVADGDKDKFLKLFGQLKQKIIDNPAVLYKDYWEN